MICFDICNVRANEVIFIISQLEPLECNAINEWTFLSFVLEISFHFRSRTRHCSVLLLFFCFFILREIRRVSWHPEMLILLH